MSQSIPEDCVKVAIMGATGTGKSSFIRLLTNDDKIHIGHDPESQTLDVQAAYYTDTTTGRPVMLIDTPGFDDSREGITDTEVLLNIVEFLQPKSGEAQKLNGLIYTHRISDVRVGGLARKNIRMFKALCGDAGLRNVRVVTTNWDGIKEEDGTRREILLMNGVFKDLLVGGARMCRHTNTIKSAQKIMSELVPLPEFNPKIQQEIESGMALGDTGAGRIVNQDLEELRKKHQQDLANLRAELEAAAQAHDKALRNELRQENRALEAKVARADADRAMLMKTLEELRTELAVDREAQKKLLEVLREKRRSSVIKVAVVGAIGTGKSTFIRHLTNNNKIRIGSEVLCLQTSRYTDAPTGRTVMLIDTPGLDDSAVGITDTDVLQEIIDLLQPQKGGEQPLDGMIYMHRVSDPHPYYEVGQQTLKMMRVLCGETTLCNICVVTTHWDGVAEEIGKKREEALKNGAFRALFDAGAMMHRYDNTVDSARNIMSELFPLRTVDGDAYSH